MPPLGPTGRLLVRVGASCLVLGSIGSLWHFLSAQSPSSPFWPGTLPGPVHRFGFWALAAGVLLPVSALLLQVADPTPSRHRRIGLTLLVGTVLKLTGLLIGGLLGVYGVQIMDPRPSSVVVMSLRIVGDAAVLGALVVLARDLWVRRDLGP